MKARSTPRSHRCSACSAKFSGKVCPECKTRYGTKRGSSRALADALWAKSVKGRGACQANGEIMGVHAKERYWAICEGRLEAAHVVPRRFRSTRWLLENGRALCHAHHRYFTDHERAWRDFIGPDWDRLWDLAQVRWNRTYPIAELRAALKQSK